MFFPNEWNAESFSKNTIYERQGVNVSIFIMYRFVIEWRTFIKCHALDWWRVEDTARTHVSRIKHPDSIAFRTSCKCIFEFRCIEKIKLAYPTYLLHHVPIKSRACTHTHMMRQHHDSWRHQRSAYVQCTDSVAPMATWTGYASIRWLMSRAHRLLWARWFLLFFFFAKIILLLKFMKCFIHYVHPYTTTTLANKILVLR